MSQILPVGTIGWFIDSVLLGDLERMVLQSHLHYLGFGLVSGAIEFLGACTDEHDFDKRKLSEERFNSAISDLFPSQYAACADPTSDRYLYGPLRCGMAHTLSPRAGVVLTAISDGGDPARHLTATSAGVLLVSEVFYIDFASACHELKRRMEASDYKKKLSDPYLHIGPVMPHEQL